MWGELSNGERMKVQKVILKEEGTEVCTFATQKQWSPKWSTCIRGGTQDKEGRKYFSYP